MRIATAIALALLVACTRDAPPGPAPPPGRAETTTSALEAGTVVLQSTAPVDRLGIHLPGFHPLKDDPDHQMTAHHYCRQVNEDFTQCVLFDSAGADANLNGIEYSVSDKLFESLPAEERRRTHRARYPRGGGA